MDNYRPISVLPGGFEDPKRAVQIQLLQHLDNSSQLSPFQCAGLRKNHSIQDAVSYFTDCFRKGIACSRRLDSGEQVKSYAASAKRNRALIFCPHSTT